MSYPGEDVYLFHSMGSLGKGSLYGRLEEGLSTSRNLSTDIGLFDQAKCSVKKDQETRKEHRVIISIKNKGSQLDPGS